MRARHHDKPQHSPTTAVVSKPGRYLSPPQVARRLGVNADKVRLWLSNGELRGINVAARLGGRPRWRISEADLLAFQARRSAGAEGQRTRVRRRQRSPDVIEFF
jgi:excisionase family DNA binding protein